ncbi:MAG: epoxyqueuosine reductase QueH [Ruminococcus sp.]|nr:epoxyqueuosine reductase QueH [Ruminococcus sp.]
MESINIQKLTDKILKECEETGIKKLLLHSCCAPCSSYCLEYLSPYFEITDMFYNPNIYPEEEYKKREKELERLIDRMPHENPIHFIAEPYDKNEFFDAVKGLEALGEGSERCRKCFELRLERAARYAAENGFDYFTTTLSISPYKNARVLYEVSDEMSKKYGVKFLPSDFKKKNGYKRSIELSREYELYRQDYCGCIFSQKESQKRRQDKENENG